MNATTPTSIGVSDKFESSHPHFCPIIGYKVEKIMDLKTNREADGRWYSKIFIGDSIDVNNVLSWTNLVLTDTSRKIDFEVHIAALNGNISSDTTNHTINLKIDKAPNKAPVFFEEPDEVIFVDLNKLGNSTVFRKLMPEIYDQNIWDILRVEIFLED